MFQTREHVKKCVLKVNYWFSLHSGFIPSFHKCVLKIRHLFNTAPRIYGQYSILLGKCGECGKWASLNIHTQFKMASFSLVLWKLCRLFEGSLKASPLFWYLIFLIWSYFPQIITLQFFFHSLVHFLCLLVPSLIYFFRFILILFPIKFYRPINTL